MSNRANVSAFPRPVSQDPTGRHDAQDGATLREYLTGQALVGVMALNAGCNPDYELVSAHAVALADLTLIALNDVTHEDTVKRISELVAVVKAEQESWNASRDPRAFAGLSRGPRDEDLGQTQEDQKEPAAGGGQLPTPSPESFRAKAPEVEPPKTDGEDKA